MEVLGIGEDLLVDMGFERDEPVGEGLGFVDPARGGKDAGLEACGTEDLEGGTGQRGFGVGGKMAGEPDALALREGKRFGAGSEVHAVRFVLQPEQSPLRIVVSDVGFDTVVHAAAAYGEGQVPVGLEAGDGGDGGRDRGSGVVRARGGGEVQPQKQRAQKGRAKDAGTARRSVFGGLHGAAGKMGAAEGSRQTCSTGFRCRREIVTPIFRGRGRGPSARRLPAGPRTGETGAAQLPCSASQRSVSMAAWQPMPAAVIAWR